MHKKFKHQFLAKMIDIKGFHYLSAVDPHYRFEIRQNSVKSTVRSEIDHFRCKIGSGWYVVFEFFL